MIKVKRGWMDEAVRRRRRESWECRVSYRAGDTSL
jgi:hypothetical protein